MRYKQKSPWVTLDFGLSVFLVGILGGHIT